MYKNVFRYLKKKKMRRKRTQTEGSDASDHFLTINDRRVDDIR